MPVFVEDSAQFSKSRLKSDLIAHNVALPPSKSKKEVYVELHMKHVNHKNAADFSSDEEDQEQDVAVSWTTFLVFVCFFSPHKNSFNWLLRSFAIKKMLSISTCNKLKTLLSWLSWIGCLIWEPYLNVSEKLANLKIKNNQLSPSTMLPDVFVIIGKLVCCDWSLVLNLIWADGQQLWRSGSLATQQPSQLAVALDEFKPPAVSLV